MQTVKIRLRKPTRVFTFLTSGVTLKRNETCIVRSDRGIEYGTCVLGPEESPDDIARRVKMSVVRRATEADEESFSDLVREECRAMDVCGKRIQKHGLDMKLVDAEYTFDKQKVTFYFTAADRVDFRQLVRDLAHELKTRIELRHIQVRDEAKLLGGLGVCGRELCCATWLPEFKPISMKMAKRQNISLNPSKISGQCGRLLCCLEYENDLYQSRKKRSQPQNPNEEWPEDQESRDLEEEAEPETVATETGDSVPTGGQDTPTQQTEENTVKRSRKRRGRRRRSKRKKSQGESSTQGNKG